MGIAFLMHFSERNATPTYGHSLDRCAARDCSRPALVSRRRGTAPWKCSIANPAAIPVVNTLATQCGRFRAFISVPIYRAVRRVPHRDSRRQNFVLFSVILLYFTYVISIFRNLFQVHSSASFYLRTEILTKSPLVLLAVHGDSRQFSRSDE